MNSKCRMSFLALVAVTGFFISAFCVHADSWFRSVGSKEHKYDFGDLRIVLVETVKQGGRQAMPEWSLSIYRKDKLVAESSSIAFTALFASSDHRFFLGVSETGFTKVAFVIFDSDGHVIKDLPFPTHFPRKAKEIRFCDGTTFLQIPWYDNKNPEPEFVIEGGKLKDVKINGCDGKRCSLLKID